MGRKKLLLVDDTETVVLFEKLTLGPSYEYRRAANGQEAIEVAREFRPDLILLDVMMPVMDGIECVGLLKEDPETMDIPVIMVTTRGESENIEKCFARGCDDYVTKPINRSELLAKVAKYLDK